MSLKPFSRSNPCPICEGGSNCRYDRDGSKILCHSNIDFDPNHSDWYFVRPSESGVWGVFVPRKDRSDYDPEKARQAKTDRHLREQVEKEKRSRESLPIEARDKAIRGLSRHFGLSSKHRNNLHRRGLTDGQIKEGLFFTVVYGEPVPFGIPWNLAGVKDGKLSNRDGLACIAFDGNGLAIGYQIRVDDTNEGKYRWAKGECFSHLPDGELPITLVTANKSKDLYLCEGILKPFVANAKHDINCLGAAGGHFSGSPNQVKEAVKGYERLIIVLDAGDLANRQVKKRWAKEIGFLETLDLTILIADWGQGESKENNDIDEITNLNALTKCAKGITYKTPREVFSCEPVVHKLRDWLKKSVKFQPRKAKKTPKGTTYFYNSAHPFPTEDKWESWGKPIIRFKGGEDRATVINAAIASGHQFIWDKSFMGLGKSHAVPELVNPDGKIFYISQDHRNPTIERIKEEFTDLVPRTKTGFTERDGRLVKADQETHRYRKVIEPNCHRAELFEKVYQQNHSVFREGEVNPICGTCPKLSQCRAFGYLNQRSKAFGAIKIRADINGLDRFTDYSGDVLVIDELKSLTPTKQVVTNQAKLLSELDQLRSLLNAKIYSYLDDVVQSLKPLYKAEQGQYGLTTERIREVLPSHPYLAEIIEFLTISPIDLTEYFREADNVKTGDKRFKRLASLANLYLSKEALKDSHEKLESLTPNALILILKLIQGEAVQANLKGDRLTLTIDNRFYTNIFEQAKAIALLDATASLEKVRLTTGIEDWLEIEQEIKDLLANLTINLIETDGLGSNNWSDTAIERTKLLRQSLGEDAPIVGFKKHVESLKLDGYWFRDNIGSNKFKGVERLIATGKPCPNYGQVRDDFLAIGGSIDDFDEYYQYLIDEQVLQLVGRQRSHLFSDREFTIDWVGTDLDLDWLTEYGCKVTKISAYEINSATGTQEQVLKTAYFEAVKLLLINRVKVTQKAIAGLVGVTQANISERLNQWGCTVKDVIRLAEKNITQPISNSIGRVIFSELRDWLKLTALEQITEAMEAIALIGWAEYARSVLPLLPNSVQIRILGLLIGFLAVKPNSDTA